MDADVLIIGAGPTGLTLANDLLRRDISVCIIDEKDQPSIHSKALAIFPRTLEVMDNLGLVSEFLERGRQLRGARVFSGQKPLTSLEFDGLDSPYPFVLCLPQSQTESILLDGLRARGTDVRWQTELVDFQQTMECVAAIIRRPDGAAGEIRGRVLVGCDGAHSLTREFLDVDYGGEDIPVHFAFADARAEGDLSPDHFYAHFSPEGTLALIPLPDDGYWRLITQISEEDSGDDPPPLAFFENAAMQRAGLPLRLSDPRWVTTFGIRQRKANAFHRDRLFLAGDAAHNHSPAGGQGMNYGIQDAVNLGWKLELVLKGEAPPTLLGSYTAEREPLADSLLQGTGWFTKVATLQHPIAQHLRNAAFRFFGSFEFVEHRLRNVLSELSLSYENSPVVMNDTYADLFQGGCLPGERAPLVATVTVNAPDGPKQCSLADLLRGTRHVLLAFATPDMNREEPASQFDALESVRKNRMHVVTVPLPSKAEQASHDGNALVQRLGIQQESAYLIRPDGYVAGRGPLDPVLFEAYWAAKLAPSA